MVDHAWAHFTCGSAALTDKHTHAVTHRSRPAEPRGKWEQRSTQAHSATAALICPALSQTRTLSLTGPDTCSTLTSSHTPAQGHPAPPFTRMINTSFTDVNSTANQLQPSWLLMQIQEYQPIESEPVICRKLGCNYKRSLRRIVLQQRFPDAG